MGRITKTGQTVIAAGSGAPAMALALALGLAAASCGGKGGSVDADAGDDAVDTAVDTGDVPADTAGDGDAADAPDTAGDPDAEDSAEAEDAADSTDAPDAEEDVAPDCTPTGVGADPDQELDACLEAVQCVALPGDMTAVEGMSLCMFWPMFREQAAPVGDAMRMLVTKFYLMLFDGTRASAACVAAAADCEGVLACLNDGTTSGACTLPFAALPAWGDSCDGSVLNVCQQTEPGVATSGRLYRHDCAGDGLACVETALGAGCMNTDCGAAAEPECVGDVYDYCIRPGAHVTVDCRAETSALDGTCGDTDPATVEMEPGCVPGGGACVPGTDAPYCDGDVLRECDAEWSRWVGTDCADLGTGWRCDVMGGHSSCLPDITSWACTLTPDPACDCNDVVACDVFTGEDVRLHCPGYGYETCGDTDPSTIEVEPGCV